MYYNTFIFQLYFESLMIETWHLRIAYMDMNAQITLINPLWFPNWNFHNPFSASKILLCIYVRKNRICQIVCIDGMLFDFDYIIGRQINYISIDSRKHCEIHPATKLLTQLQRNIRFCNFSALFSIVATYSVNNWKNVRECDVYKRGKCSSFWFGSSVLHPSYIWRSIL